MKCKSKYCEEIVFWFFVIFISSCTLSDKQFKKSNPYINEVSTIGQINLKNHPNCSDFKDYYVMKGCNVRDNDNNIIKTKKFSFGVVEFDDYGQLRSESQYRAVKKLIFETVKDKRTVFVLYVHGWKHNASEGSGNLKDFRNFIIDSGENDPCNLIDDNNTQNSNKCHIVGIYIAWRGDPFAITENSKSNELTFIKRVKGLIKTFSIHNRKKAAKKVSTIRPTHVILDLLKMVDRADSKRLSDKKYNNGKFNAVKPCALIKTMEMYKQKNEGCSYKIMIGHSFGATFLENTIAQAFIGQKHLASQLKINDQMYRIIEDFEKLQNDVDETKKLKKEQEDKESQLNTAKNSYSHFVSNLEDTIKGLTNKIEKDESEQQLVIQPIKGSYDNIFQDGKNEQRLNDLIQILNLNMSNYLQKPCLNNYQSSAFDIENIKNLMGVKAIKLNQNRRIKDFLEYYSGIVELFKLLESDYTNHYTFFDYITFKNEIECIKDEINPLVESFKGLEDNNKSLITIARKEIRKIDEIFEKLVKLGENINESTLDLSSKRAKIDTTRIKINLQEHELKTIGLYLNKLNEWIIEKKKEITLNFEQLIFYREKAFSPPANIVILLNPASEAISANMLINSFCQQNDSNKFKDNKVNDYLKFKQKPWLISVGSKGDLANKYAFNVFSNLELILKVTEAGPRSAKSSLKFNVGSCTPFISQYDLVTKTAPNIHKLISHTLLKECNNSLNCIDSDKIQFKEDIKTCFKSSVSKNKVTLILEGVSKQRNFLQCIAEHGNSILDENNPFPIILDNKIYYFDKYNKNLNNGYWVFNTDKKVVKNHNDIFNENIGSLIYGLMKYTEDGPICDTINHKAFKAYCENEYSKNLY